MGIPFGPRYLRAVALAVCQLLVGGCGGVSFVAPAAAVAVPVNPPVVRLRAADTAAPLATLPAASRLLDQATFGPTGSDVQHVQSVGLDAYLTEQFNTAPSALPVRLDDAFQRKTMEGEFFTLVMSAPDQLRQRVAFALSEMFVVSDQAVPPQEIAPFHNMLARDAFGNFSTLLKDVTLSPAMGEYLNMLNSAAAADGEIANENYARELMQLFTIGLYQLNPDGTVVLDSSGQPIPTYTPEQVQAFARAYTGWTYASSDGSAAATLPNPVPNYSMPMGAVEGAHDAGSKLLLNGTMLQAGNSAEQDLDGALENIFAHPNVGPFVCRQLIQHLVMGNPSPAYVARAAAVFADNGHGVRGDMTAVIRAILMDYKARAGDAGFTYIDGHLREPILYLTAVYRGLGYNGDAGSLRYRAGELFQEPYESPSVFNYFPPDYILPGGAINGAMVNAPEFAIENTATVEARNNVADEIVFNAFPEADTNQTDLISVDLSATSPLGRLASSAPDLVDALGAVFMHGQMPSDMRQVLVDHVNTLSDPAQRVRVATYLVITSPQYKDEH